jgi:putative spermidine/putrescine transport system permease protein
MTQGATADRVLGALGNAAIVIFVVLFFTFLLAPILVVVVVSFSSLGYIGFPIPAFSLRWFQRIVEYQPFLDGLRVSIELAVAATALAMLLGVPAGLAVARSSHRWAQWSAAFLLSPISMPMIVLGYSQLYYFSALGLGTSFLSLWLAHTVIGIPYIVRMVVGVYRSMPADYEESAMLLGAGRLSALWLVTLPMIRPGIFAGALFAFLVSFDNLPISYFFGSPSTSTLPVVILSYIQNQFDPSIAAVSTVQLTMALVILLLLDRFYGLRRVGAPAS